MKRVITFSILICLLAAPGAVADKATHTETALELLEVMNTRAIMDQLLSYYRAMVDQQIESLQLPPESEKATAAVQKEMMDWISSIFEWEQMQGLYAELYAEAFSETELKALIEFYKSPIGQKLLEKMPELIERSMEKTQELIQPKLPEYKKRLEDMLFRLEQEYNME